MLVCITATEMIRTLKMTDLWIFKPQIKEVCKTTNDELNVNTTLQHQILLVISWRLYEIGRNNSTRTVLQATMSVHWTFLVLLAIWVRDFVCWTWRTMACANVSMHWSTMSKRLRKSYTILRLEVWCQLSSISTL